VADASTGASAGANTPAARGRARGARGRGRGGRRVQSAPREKEKGKDFCVTVVIQEISVSKAEERGCFGICIEAAKEMRSPSQKFNLNVGKAQAVKIGSHMYEVRVACTVDEAALKQEKQFMTIVDAKVFQHNSSFNVNESAVAVLAHQMVNGTSGGGGAASVSATSMVVRASGSDSAAPEEQDGVISVPTKGPRDMWECQVTLPQWLATESGHPFAGIAISLLRKYKKNKWGNVRVVDVTDESFKIKARKEVIERFRTTLLTRWVKFEMRVEADFGACELAARKVGKEINALKKVRATIDTAGIKIVGKFAVVQCSVSLSAVDLLREAFKTQVTEVPSAPRGRSGAPHGDTARVHKVFVRGKISCESVRETTDCFESAKRVAQKFYRSGQGFVKVIPYDGKPGAEVCVTYSCEEHMMDLFRERVIKQVAFDDEKAVERSQFEGCKKLRAWDSEWLKGALDRVTRQKGLKYIFTGRVKIYKNVKTGKLALAEELPADVSRGRVPRIGPVTLWAETRESAYSEYVLRSADKMLTEEDQDTLADEVDETLAYFEANSFSIPDVKLGGKSLAFMALERRAAMMHTRELRKVSFQKGCLKGTTVESQEVAKNPWWKQVNVIGKKCGKGRYGPIVRFVCKAGPQASISNYVGSVRRELQELYFENHLGASMRAASHRWLDRARGMIAVKQDEKKERAGRMALYKEQQARSTAASLLRAQERMDAASGNVMMDARKVVVVCESAGTGGALCDVCEVKTCMAMEMTPYGAPDSGDESDDLTFATSNPFGVLKVDEISVAATKSGAAMVEPEKAPKKSRKKKSRGTILEVDIRRVGEKGKRG